MGPALLTGGSSVRDDGYDGYWVVSVDRATGAATTSDLIEDRAEAWQLSVELEEPRVFTTVVPRRRPGRSPT